MILYRVTHKELGLQRWYYWIYTICNFVFTIPCNCKLFFDNSLNKSLKYFIFNRVLNLNLDLSYFNSLGRLYSLMFCGQLCISKLDFLIQQYLWQMVYATRLKIYKEASQQFPYIFAMAVNMPDI